MFTLPRGAFAGRENVRLASAEWGQPNEVARFPYIGGGALFVGALPYEDAWPKLLDIWKKAGELRAAITARTTSPVERARDLQRLEAIWLQAMKADCMPIGFDDDRHVVTIANARSGKGLSSIVPNLCLYPGSVVCLDPKGENASITAERRGPGNEWCEGMGQEVYVLDPFGVAEVPDELRASLNPLALLDKNSSLIVDDAGLLAEGLVVAGDGGGDDHWTETSRNLVRGIILHLVSTYDAPTLFDLRRLLTQGEKVAFELARAKRMRHTAKVAAAKAAFERHRAEVDPDADFEEPPEPPGLMPASIRNPFAYLLWQMENNDAFEGVVAGSAESILGTGENERGGILSTARRNTSFLDTLGDRYKDTLSGAFRPFDPDRLKAAPEGVSVYLCLPPERMGTHGRWLRLMIGLFLERMQRQLIAPASGVPALFLLEEFFSLGTMPAIEKAAGYAAGFGVKLWVILQDLQQLKSLYRTSWQTFLANAGMVQIFGASDYETLDYASKAAGEYEVSRVTSSVTTNSNQGESSGSELDRVGPAFGRTFLQSTVMAGVRLALDDTKRSTSTATSESQSVGLHVVPLLRPDEIALQFAREAGASLLLIKGQRPMWVLRVNYSESPWFTGTFTPLAKWRDQARRGARPAPFWTRSPDGFKAVAAAFNDLAGGSPATPPRHTRGAP